MDDLTGNEQDVAVLRRELRAQRRAVSTAVRAQAARQAAQLAQDWLMARLGSLCGRQVGVFLALDEELDTTPLLDTLWCVGVQTYLPFVHARAAALHWQPYGSDTTLTSDTLGIAAPADIVESRLLGMALDAVVTPLVGWDRRGYRIGMGGGFYDRTFAAKMSGIPPFLLGYAFACQEVGQGITPQPWDVRLDGLVNEQEKLFFTGA